jgi:fatty acid amide hydrolase 2
MPLLRVMAGPDGVDPNAEELPLGDPAGVDWRGRPVLLLENPRITGAFPATGEVRAAAAAAAAALARRGADVRPLPREFFRGALRIWFAALHSTAAMPLAQLIGGGTPPVLSLELARVLLRRAHFTFPAIMFALMEKVQHLSDGRTRELLAAGRRLGAKLDEALGPEGILVMPAHPRAAPRHHAPYLRPFDFAFTAVFNILRVPVTAIPVGLNANGLPLAVQAVARRGCDHLTIAAALALEEELGGWRPPTRLEGLG